MAQFGGFVPRNPLQQHQGNAMVQRPFAQTPLGGLGGSGNSAIAKLKQNAGMRVLLLLLLVRLITPLSCALRLLCACPLSTR